MPFHGDIADKCNGIDDPMTSTTKQGRLNVFCAVKGVRDFRCDFDFLSLRKEPFSLHKCRIPPRQVRYWLSRTRQRNLQTPGEHSCVFLVLVSTRTSTTTSSPSINANVDTTSEFESRSASFCSVSSLLLLCID